MRSRFIKPGFFKNEELAELDPLGRILFAGLWCMADKAGRLEDRPRRIKAELLPYDNYDVEAALTWLAKHRFIIRYQVGGARYIQVKNWKHQSPHHTEAGSTIPPYEESPSSNVDDTSINGEVTVSSPLDNDTVLNTDYLLLDTDYLTDGADAQPQAAEVRAVPKPRATSVKSTTIPVEFCLTAEMEAWAVQKGYTQLLNLKEETEEFIAYWSEGEGMGERRKNWPMVWRNRMKERFERLQALQRRGSYTNGSRPETRQGKAIRVLDDLAREAINLTEGPDRNRALGPGS